MKKQILSQEHSLSNYDLSVQISRLIGGGIGDGIGAAVYLGILSAIYKRALKSGLAILGDLSVSGAIRQANNFKDKLAILSENGAKLVLSPMENLKEVQDVPPSILVNTDVNFYSNSQMILQKAILSE